jgi:hypothetical protein
MKRSNPSPVPGKETGKSVDLTHPAPERKNFESDRHAIGNLATQLLVLEGAAEHAAESDSELCDRGIPCGHSAGSCGGCKHHLVQRKPIDASAHSSAPDPPPAVFVQAKLSISQPGDPSELEADRMAEGAVAENPVRSCDGIFCPGGGCQSCVHRMAIQRKASDTAGLAVSAGDIKDVLRSGGQPLNSSVQESMESHFGADFSSIRIYTGPQAASSARSIDSLAYTVGRDVIFGNGQYSPETTAGRRLLAHELTHVIQQGEAGRAPSHKSPSKVMARPTASIHRQIEILGELPPELGPLGRGIGRLGPLERLGPGMERIGRIAPEMDRIGPDRISPEWRPWSPEGWRTPPSIQEPPPTPTQGTGPQPFPWSGPYPPFPWMLPQTYPQPNPNPQPLPQPDEEEQRDPRCGTPQLPLTQVIFSPGPLGQGRYVKASPLTKCPGNTRGTEPNGSIYRDQFDCINAAGEGGSWVRAHLLHGRTSSSGPFNLHGPGYTPLNLIITDKSLNGQMRVNAEGPAIARVYGGSDVLWYESTVDSYYPGLEYFGQSITVNYGRYNTTTGTEGPREGGGTFSLKRTPPNCPVTPLGGGILAPGTAAPSSAGGAGTAAPSAAGGGVAPPTVGGVTLAPTSTFNFQSTIQICHRTLTSRTIHVGNGGLMVRIDARWFNASGSTEQSGEDCPISQYHISLREKGWLWDSEIGTFDMTVGRPETVYWRYLDPGDYYLFFWTLNDNPNCCLQGDVVVSTFDALPSSGSLGPELEA